MHRTPGSISVPYVFTLFSFTISLARLRQPLRYFFVVSRDLILIEILRLGGPAGGATALEHPGRGLASVWQGLCGRLATSRPQYAPPLQLFLFYFIMLFII
jgi:hypothetical protein